MNKQTHTHKHGFHTRFCVMFFVFDSFKYTLRCMTSTVILHKDYGGYALNTRYWPQYMWLLKQCHLLFAWVIITIYLFGDFNMYGTLDFQQRKKLYLNNYYLLAVMCFTLVLYLLLPIIYVKFIAPKLLSGEGNICNILSPCQAILLQDIDSLKFMEYLGTDFANPNYPMVFI